MKKIFLILLCCLFGLSAYATGDCRSKDFNEIRNQAKLMEKAWDSADLKGVVSFYDDDFMYMSGGKPYTSKEKVLKHYVDSFVTGDSTKLDLGKLKLDYQYCRDLDKDHQLVIMKFTWTSPAGEVASGHDLLVWQKNKDGSYRIIVDFPQS